MTRLLYLLGALIEITVVFGVIFVIAGGACVRREARRCHGTAESRVAGETR